MLRRALPYGAGAARRRRPVLSAVAAGPLDVAHGTRSPRRGGKKARRRLRRARRTEHRSGRHPFTTALSPLLRYLAPSPPIQPARVTHAYPLLALPGAVFAPRLSSSSSSGDSRVLQLCHVLLLPFSSLFLFFLPKTLRFALRAAAYNPGHHWQQQTAPFVRPSIREQLSRPSAGSARDFEPPRSVASPLPSRQTFSSFAWIAAKFSLFTGPHAMERRRGRAYNRALDNRLAVVKTPCPQDPKLNLATQRLER